MEEKKFDLNSIIGFILIFGILLFMMWKNQPTPEELVEQEKAKQEQVEADKKAAVTKTTQDTIVTSAADYSNNSANDSLQLEGLKSKLGAFAYASSLPSATDKETTVETDVLALKFSNKGGFLSEVMLRNFVDYDSVPIHLIKNGNQNFQGQGFIERT